jgi:hypothetical protein
MKPAVLLLVSLILACPAMAIAQAGDEENRPGQDQGSTSEGSTRQPPPPLFPKHRRGLYRAGLGPPVLDGTPQSPPLEIDDPGVPDMGEFELNFSTQGDLAHDVSQFDLLLVDANYGLVLKVFGHDLPTQVKVEFPIAGAKAADEPFTAGLGAFTLGLKLNVYNNERKGVFLSVYPQFECPARNDAIEKDLATEGETLVLPILVQKEFSQITLVVNGALRQPFHDAERTTTGVLSAAIGRAITRRYVLMGEARFESAFDFERERLVAFNGGIMHDLGSSLVVYANLGQSVFVDGGSAHTFVGVGLKVLAETISRKH